MYSTFHLAVPTFWGRLYHLLAFPALVLFGSAVWFFGGYWDFKDSLKEGKKPKGFLAAGVGVFILVAYSIAELVSRKWLGLVLTAAGAGFEIWHLKHRWQLLKPPAGGAGANNTSRRHLA